MKAQINQHIIHFYNIFTDNVNNEWYNQFKSNEFRYIYLWTIGHATNHMFPVDEHTNLSQYYKFTFQLNENDSI